jgi:hypothetical protein
MVINSRERMAVVPRDVNRSGICRGFAAVPAILGGQQAAGLLGSATMLVSIILIGLLASWISAILAMRWPLSQALRSTI